jgi:hypothetical protein
VIYVIADSGWLDSYAGCLGCGEQIIYSGVGGSPLVATWYRGAAGSELTRQIIWR